nr:MAG TPA: hypothetical protein [Caudoviricetes sp.]
MSLFFKLENGCGATGPCMIAWLIIFRISYKLGGLIPLEVLIKSHMVVWLFVL